MVAIIIHLLLQPISVRQTKYTCESRESVAGISRSRPKNLQCKQRK